MPECRACQNRENLELVIAKEMFLGTREKFKYFICPSCSSLSIGEIPKNLAELYSKYPIFDLNPVKMGFWKRFARRYTLLNKNALASLTLKYLDSWEDLAFRALHGLGLNLSTKILDVGCGSGILVGILNSFGFKDITGIDPYLSETVEQPGLRLIKGTVMNLNEQFDLVMCNHSFEHVEDASLTAKKLETLVKPGGWLIIRLPNIESYSFKKYRENWHGIHAPFHLVLPSLEGMKNIFHKTDLVLQERRQEQLVELFLYNIDYSLNIGLTEPLGVLTCLGDGPLGNKIPPLFTKREIVFLKDKVKAVIESKVADYIAYYYKKNEAVF